VVTWRLARGFPTAVVSDDLLRGWQIVAVQFTGSCALAEALTTESVKSSAARATEHLLHHAPGRPSPPGALRSGVISVCCFGHLALLSD